MKARHSPRTIDMMIDPILDVSAVELDGFLLAALSNPKDRLFLLKLDKEMEHFIMDNKYTHVMALDVYHAVFRRMRLEFPQMNSYQRLIVHRVAQYFGLSHVVDGTKKAIVLYKSPTTEM